MTPDLHAAEQRCLRVADSLITAHSEAYRKADLSRNEDAMSFIAGLRDGATGVRDAICKEFETMHAAGHPDTRRLDHLINGLARVNGPGGFVTWYHSIRGTFIGRGISAREAIDDAISAKEPNA